MEVIAPLRRKKVCAHAKIAKKASPGKEVNPEVSHRWSVPRIVPTTAVRLSKIGQGAKGDWRSKLRTNWAGVNADYGAISFEKALEMHVGAAVRSAAATDHDGSKRRQ